MALIAALRSAVYAFSADRLSQIRAAAPTEDFYTALTLDGGLLRLGSVQGGAHSLLRLTGGAAVLLEKPAQSGETAALTVPVVLDGPASLMAARASVVRDTGGKALQPFDVVWKRSEEHTSELQSQR